MINLILLAAGYSSRFGENKLLYEIEGVPMHRRMLNSAVEFQERCKACRIILVTAYGEIAEYALSEAGFLEDGSAYSGTHGSEAHSCPCLGSEAHSCSCGGKILVRNRNQSAGISHSIRLGIEASDLSTEEDTMMFCVCDQPYLTWADLVALTDGFYRSGKGIGGLCTEGIIGNPVIFQKKYREELLLLKGDEGGKRVVKRHGADTYRCEARAALSLMDIDTKEEGELYP